VETNTTKSGFDLRERPEVKLMNTSRKKTWTCRSSAAQAAQLQAEEIQPIPVGKRVYLAELEAESDALGNAENGWDSMSSSSSSRLVCFPMILNFGVLVLGLSIVTEDLE